MELSADTRQAVAYTLLYFTLFIWTADKWFEVGTVQFQETVPKICYPVRSTNHPERESFYDRHNSFIRCNCRFFYGLTAAGCRFCRAMHIAAIAVMRTCLSVCVSITFVDSVKTNKRIFKIFAPSGSQTILFFFVPNGMATLRREPPNGGIECRWARQKSRFWAYIWLRCILSVLWPATGGQVLSKRRRRATCDTYRCGGVS